MTPTRTRWLFGVAILLLASGAVFLLRWPRASAVVECAEADLRWRPGPNGPVAVCDPGSPRTPGPVGPALTLGVRIDLNRASAADLALLPGVGPSLANELVEARTSQGGFRSWDDVDRVAGVGPAKLEVLKAHGTIRP